MAKFKIGEIVELKSGSPIMTVTGICTSHEGVETGYIECAWFVGRKDGRESFPEECLQYPNAETTGKVVKK